MGDCPVMNAARPAVQLCWPYQSVNSAPSLGDAVDVRRLVAHHAHVVGADVELADVVAPDDEDVGLLLLLLRRLARLPSVAAATTASEPHRMFLTLLIGLNSSLRGKALPSVAVYCVGLQ